VPARTCEVGYWHKVAALKHCLRLETESYYSTLKRKENSSLHILAALDTHITLPKQAKHVFCNCKTIMLHIILRQERCPLYIYMSYENTAILQRGVRYSAIFNLLLAIKLLMRIMESFGLAFHLVLSLSPYQ
jgi:hypothetical protein